MHAMLQVLQHVTVGRCVQESTSAWQATWCQAVNVLMRADTDADSGCTLLGVVGARQCQQCRQHRCDVLRLCDGSRHLCNMPSERR